MLNSLAVVLERTLQGNLTLNPKNCELSNFTEMFLGHIVFVDGVSINPNKAQTRNWPTP